MLDFIGICSCLRFMQKKAITCFFNELRTTSYNLFTGFPQKLWKTPYNHALVRVCSVLLCLVFLTSCSYFRSAKKDAKPAAQPKVAEQAKPAETPKKKSAPEPKKTRIALDNALIDQGQEEVKKQFGEPDVVSKTPENQILWTYRPKWKLIPDSADTVYVQFVDGKVVKIVRTQ